MCFAVEWIIYFCIYFLWFFQLNLIFVRVRRKSSDFCQQTNRSVFQIKMWEIKEIFGVINLKFKTNLNFNILPSWMELIHQLFKSRVNPGIMHPAGWLVELVDSNQSWNGLFYSQVTPEVKNLVRKGLSILTKIPSIGLNTLGIFLRAPVNRLFIWSS